MDIYVLFYDRSISFADVEGYIPLLSKRRQERINRLRREEDKVSSVMAGMLSEMRLSLALGEPCKALRFYTEEYGRPRLKDQRDVTFSLSHSANAVAFAIGYCDVGVDIQKIDHADMRVADRFFTGEECAFIRNSEDRDRAFHYIWTRKEAFVKMTGRGLGQGLGSFEVFDDIGGHSFFTQEIDGFMLSVCAGEREHRIIRVTEQELFDFFAQDKHST